jgi:DNA-directed RNA polymerase subunit RPC12/RpoP
MLRIFKCCSCKKDLDLKDLLVGDSITCPFCYTRHMISETWYEDDGFVEYIEIVQNKKE